MSWPVLPIGRDDGYYWLTAGRLTFVPFKKPSALVIPFPQSFRATSRAVAAEIERAIDTPIGDA